MRLPSKYNIGKTLLLGLSMFGVSVIWNVYNAYVPVILADRFLMAPILGPIGYGWIIQLSGARYNFLMIVRPVFMLLALISIMCVTKGEAKQGQNIH